MPERQKRIIVLGDNLKASVKTSLANRLKMMIEINTAMLLIRSPAKGVASFKATLSIIAVPPQNITVKSMSEYAQVMECFMGFEEPYYALQKLYGLSTGFVGLSV